MIGERVCERNLSEHSCDNKATSSVEACQQARLSAHLSLMVPLKAHTLKRPKHQERPDVRTDDRVQLAVGENVTHAHAYRIHRAHRQMQNAFAR